MVRDKAHLFAKLITTDSSSPEPRANLDVDFWDRSMDYAYAGYEGVASSVKCVRQEAQLRPVVCSPLIPHQPASTWGGISAMLAGTFLCLMHLNEMLHQYSL